MNTSPQRIEVLERETVPPRAIRTLPPPSELRLEPAAWSALTTTQVDALIVGDGGVAVSRVLTFIWPTLRKPVVWCESRRLALPAQNEGTLVLEDAHALDAGDQQRLLNWLQAGTESLRLIATSSPLLLPLIEAGKFSRELYEHFMVVKLLLRGAADCHEQTVLSTQTDARNASQRN
jgi:sigma-54-interacting transcriptional regulator